MLNSAAWAKIFRTTKKMPEEIFPKFTKQEFDSLKEQYVRDYGYTIRIPQWDDIVHLVPDALKDPQVLKAERKENLVRILESPAPGWFRKFSTVMTWIDDIQDTASILFPVVRMVAGAFPKVAGKLLSGFGWVLLGYDLLNLANAIGRAPLTPMKSKREICKWKKQNPFGKAARVERAGRIKFWKPGMADLIQTLQVVDSFTGAGLSLGGVMGAVTDTIFGVYRYMSGDPVRFTFDPVDISTLGQMGSRGMRAAQAISSQGQVFSETVHFWTYVTAAMSAIALGGEYRDGLLSDMIEDPMNMAIPAPTPTNPYTIAVIEEMGLRVEDGVGWPFNEEKFISLGDLLDATVDPCTTNFWDYCNRHAKDHYGMYVAACLDRIIPNVFCSVDPGISYEVDDSDEMKVFWTMIKAPLLPARPVTKEEGEAFFLWVHDYKDLYGERPGLYEIQNKLDLMGIPYLTSYPETPAPGFEEFWPPGWSGDESY